MSTRDRYARGSRQRGGAEPPRADVLVDPYLGERYEVIESARDTGGELVRIGVAAAPGESRRRLSVHPHQEERFEVVSGILGLLVDGEERVLEAGESFVVPPDVSHLPRNPGAGEVRFVTEMRPALRFERFLEEIVEVGRSGERGLRYLLLASTVLQRFRDVERPPGLPAPVLKAMAFAGGLLLALRRVRGGGS